MANPFLYINNITNDKKDLFKDNPLAEKDYASFIVNRGLGYYPDTIMQSNMMNRYHDIPKSWQYYFLLNTITKAKRFSKWHKQDKQTESLKLVMEYYNYSPEKARQVMDILTTDQMSIIEQKLNKGGKK
jgi:hypothetical protein